MWRSRHYAAAPVQRACAGWQGNADTRVRLLPEKRAARLRPFRRGWAQAEDPARAQLAMPGDTDAAAGGALGVDIDLGVAAAPATLPAPSPRRTSPSILTAKCRRSSIVVRAAMGPSS